ncbi:MAG: hypothetical protein WCI05_06140 [Myxococcales bacterium]
MPELPLHPGIRAPRRNAIAETRPRYIVIPFELDLVVGVEPEATLDSVMSLLDTVIPGLPVGGESEEWEHCAWKYVILTDDLAALRRWYSR